MSGSASSERFRVLVVDDHDVVHWGFRLMLSELPWVERCLSARTAAEAVELARRHAPHLALVDLFVGDESGPEICERLHLVRADLRILLISGAGRISAAAARACGASGFVPKHWSAADISQAARMVCLGMTVFDDGDPRPSTALSDREREILRAIATGATNREIARELHLSPHTIKEHSSAIYRKLEVRNRAEAVQRAQRMGLLS